jgi:hypothetical protein
MAVGENFAVGTRVRANKFHGTVVKVRPTHHSQQGKIPVDSGTTVKWFRPEELKVENKTLKLIPLDQTSIDPQRLQPHPENNRIYGEHEDVSVLVELIQQSGWIKPIVVSQHRRIISGHRRWKAALELRWKEVPIFVQEFSNEVAELEALLLGKC